MKTPKIKVTQAQVNYCKDLLQGNCIAKVEDLFFKFVFNKSVQEIKHCYCSAEWNTIVKLVRWIDRGNYKNMEVVA